MGDMQGIKRPDPKEVNPYEVQRLRRPKRPKDPKDVNPYETRRYRQTVNINITNGSNGVHKRVKYK